MEVEVGRETTTGPGPGPRRVGVGHRPPPTVLVPWETAPRLEGGPQATHTRTTHLGKFPRRGRQLWELRQDLVEGQSPWRDILSTTSSVCSTRTLWVRGRGTQDYKRPF